jgi:hypothetical protein
VRVRVDGIRTIGLVSSPIPGTAVAEVAILWPPGLVGQVDSGWDWAALVQQHPDGAEWRQFQLTAAEHVQGLLIVRSLWATRSPANTGMSGAYMEYVATAPWNRLDEYGRRVDERFGRVAPVGRLLVGAAIDLSCKLGWSGRLGWHSKPGAEKWYKDVLPGIWAGGPDLEEEGLEYFEISPDVAATYLAGISNSLLGE